MTDQAWIRAQLKYLDELRHEPKSLGPYEDCASILRDARKRLAAYPAAVAACRERELVNPDAARVALATCLEAIKPQELTVKEVAARRGCKPDTVLAMIHGGRLKATNIGTKTRPRWRIAVVDLEGTLIEQPKARPKLAIKNPRY
jgi:excisionase family DNA binding protein